VKKIIVKEVISDNIIREINCLDETKVEKIEKHIMSKYDTNRFYSEIV